MKKIRVYLYIFVVALMLSGCEIADFDVDNTTTAVMETEARTEEESSTESAEKSSTEASTEASTDTALSETDTQESHTEEAESESDMKPGGTSVAITLADIPDYDGYPYVTLNNNVPSFLKEDMVTEPFEIYSDLDTFGRCGAAYANVCKELMPTEERGTIGQVKPSGWHTVKYNDRIDGNYLYNRCHLVAYQLAGENANVKNLITGTRYMNVVGMVPFENEVADYVNSTGNHVLYRVTPLFEGDNLVAAGVVMEAMSVEDDGLGVCFCVFVYNVQPGVIIDYATGDSEEDPTYMVADSTTESSSDYTDAYANSEGEVEEQSRPDTQADETTYIVNTNTGKFHYTYCDSVKQMKEKNKWERSTTRDVLISEGYDPCKNCNP